ncbi:MAG: 3D (Asp-Asp-Asp) domain-containing protein [Glaciecola sp.]|jgi:3D (Asp-Asp-Asp) domain-containing protein
MNSRISNICFAIVIIGLVVFSCKKEEQNPYEWKSIKVTATAYNSLAYQTSSNPHITAFGDSLKPGLKYIAVSRDLLKNGLAHNTLVKVEGLQGTYLVKDKMNRRFRNKIDLYMGTDVKAAKKWGIRKVSISYRIEIQNEVERGSIQIK